MNVLACLFYSSIVASILYYYMLRRLCIVKLYQDKISVYYLFLFKTIIVTFDSINSFDYYKNGFNLFSNKISPNLVIKPFDTLMLKLTKDNKAEKIELFLNMRVFEFKKLLIEIERIVIK